MTNELSYNLVLPVDTNLHWSHNKMYLLNDHEKLVL
jgi:hypothetical protein